MKSFIVVDKKYRGIIPQKKEELERARRELGSYFRHVWKDEVAALEVEKAVTKEDYNEKMEEGILFQMIGGGRYDSDGNRKFGV